MFHTCRVMTRVFLIVKKMFMGEITLQYARIRVRKTKNGASCRIMLIRMPQTSRLQQTSLAFSKAFGFSSSCGIRASWDYTAFLFHPENLQR